jgi:hypothetical protein
MRARTAVVAVLSAFAMISPPSEAASSVGTATRYGLTKGFQLVGHTDLGKRAMNSPLAVAGRCAYVGDRFYSTSPNVPGRARGGIAVVDVKDPRHPVQRSVIPPVAESTQRELRADAGLGILVVLGYSPFIGGDPQASQPVNTLKVYDIHRDCLHPKLLSTYDFGPRAPHEFFLWKDRKHPGRALAYVTFTVFAPDLMVLDLTDPASPSLAGVYDIGLDQGHKTVDFVDESGSGYTHSLSVSDDGTRAYMAGWDFGFWTLDTSLLADPPVAGVGIARPAGIGVLDTGHNVHSAAVIPGRKDVVLTQEDYAAAGHGCPFGVLRTGRLTSDGGATLEGQFSLPENDPKTCGTKNGTFSSHNPTLFHDVALVTWYSGGLRAVDLSNPARPVEAGAFVPRPTFEPELRDERLFFPKTAQKAGPLPTDSTWPGSRAEKWVGSMWSYPVVQDGLVYVADIDLGLYVLRYTGRHAAEVARAGFVEGNSSPSRYTRSAPRIVRPASQWARVAAETAAGPRTVLSPYRQVDRHALAEHGFLCL